MQRQRNCSPKPDHEDPAVPLKRLGHSHPESSRHERHMGTCQTRRALPSSRPSPVGTRPVGVAVLALGEPPGESLPFPHGDLQRADGVKSAQCEPSTYSWRHCVIGSCHSDSFVHRRGALALSRARPAGAPAPPRRATAPAPRGAENRLQVQDRDLSGTWTPQISAPTNRREAILTSAAYNHRGWPQDLVRAQGRAMPGRPACRQGDQIRPADRI